MWYRYEAQPYAQGPHDARHPTCAMSSTILYDTGGSGLAWRLPRMWLRSTFLSVEGPGVEKEGGDGRLLLLPEEEGCCCCRCCAGAEARGSSGLGSTKYTGSCAVW